MSSAPDAAGGKTAEIIGEIRNGVAFITLNRPAALNALSLGMVVELRALLHRCAQDPEVRAVLLKGAGERAFCAGGDIRSLYDRYQRSGEIPLDFFAAEYPLDYLLHVFPKPCIALIDGIVMGGGMGLAQGCKLRIVGERTRMAMPEVAIGFFPDVGGSYFLSRLPGALGCYLALTGTQIRAADALYAGLADIYVRRAEVDRLESALVEIDWGAQPDMQGVQRVLRTLSSAPDSAPLADVRPAIDAHFSCSTVPSLLRSLAEETRPPYLEWARATREIIGTRSPTMLAVTLRQLALGATLPLADCLRMELGIARQCFSQGDFLEGVRAVVVDKDNQPRWRPAAIADVTETAVQAMFAAHWIGSKHPLADLERELTP